MYERRKMELVSNAMASELSVDKVALATCIFIYYFSNLIEACTWFADIDAGKHSLSCSI